VRAGRDHTLGWGCKMRSFIIAVSIAFIWALLASLVGRFAEKKGHSANFWNVISLTCTPLVGFLYVALLSPRSELAPRAYRPCPHCSRMVKAGVEVCPFCLCEISEKPGVEKAAA
jgi:hypothetical protein